MLLASFFFSSFIEDFYQKSGVVLTEEDIRIYERDLYMSNLPERDAYISQLKAAGFTDVQVCQLTCPKILDKMNGTFRSPLSPP